jgi:nucleotide-binding universal stress UspA family protein
MARHGVNVTVERIPSMDRSTAEAIIGFANDAGAGLIVMGGYGHSKLREAVFGGVTREMLRTSPIPMLMAH